NDSVIERHHSAGGGAGKPWTLFMSGSAPTATLGDGLHDQLGPSVGLDVKKLAHRCNFPGKRLDTVAIGLDRRQVFGELLHLGLASPGLYQEKAALGEVVLLAV